MADRWWVTWSGDDVHVVPLVDLIGHELTDACICSPRSEDVEGTWMYSHSSLDGRELREVA